MKKLLLGAAILAVLAPSLGVAQAYTPNSNDTMYISDRTNTRHTVNAQSYIATQTGGNATLGANNTWTGTNAFSNTVTNSGAVNATGAVKLGGVTVENGTVTPTATLGGTGSPTASLTQNAGSKVMEFTLASAGSATNFVVTPGFTAAHGFVCFGVDHTTSTERLIQNTALSATTATLTFFNAAGTATSPGATDVVTVDCDAF
jgi:hypothetical protein